VRIVDRKYFGNVRNGPVEAILLVLVIHRRVENVNKDGGEGVGGEFILVHVKQQVDGSEALSGM